MSFLGEPKKLKASVFATLPDRFRMKGKSSTWGNANRGGALLECFLEGPSFDRAGNLFMVDVPFGRIFKMTPGGEFDVVAEYDGWPYGLKIHRDGRIFVTDYKNGLMIVDPASGSVTPLLEDHTPRSLKGVNDLIFARNGDLYFTDYGQTDLHDPTGRLYRLRNDGRLECLSGIIPGPNGLVLNTAETLVFVAATRSNEIWRMTIMPDGSIVKVSIFARLGGGVGPDGLAADQAGNVFVAHPGFGVVWGFSRRGEPIYRIDSPNGDEVTNLAFGGPDRRTLFITEADGHILTVDLPDAGNPMYSHAAA